MQVFQITVPSSFFILNSYGESAHAVGPKLGDEVDIGIVLHLPFALHSPGNPSLSVQLVPLSRTGSLQNPPEHSPTA